MNNILPLLKKLISASGLSGYEIPVRDLIEEAWRPLTDELSHSRVGSLHGLKRGTAPEPRPSLLIAAHMDAIGLMVTRIQGELLRITTVGGIDVRVLPGQLVTVHGREDLPGVVAHLPSRMLPDDVQKKAIPLQHLFIDTGLPSARLKRLVRTGDLVSFAQPPLETLGDTLVGHTLDNRASVVALTSCLEALQDRPHPWDVWAIASVQEEVGLVGAFTSAYQLRPSLAIAVDVTWASGPGSPGHKTFPLGKGPTLVWGPNIHPGLHQRFKELAESLEIPHSLEVTPRHSGTDGYALQVAGEGIPTMVIGIPLRYMHTPIEMVALKDITRAGRLMAEFISQLEPDYIQQLIWND
jgi:putative aminopeptidase FrvX